MQKSLGKHELLDHSYYPAVLPMRDYTGQQNTGFFNPLYCAANLEGENPGISVKQAPPDLQLEPGKCFSAAEHGRSSWSWMAPRFPRNSRWAHLTQHSTARNQCKISSWRVHSWRQERKTFSASLYQPASDRNPPAKISNKHQFEEQNTFSREKCFAQVLQDHHLFHRPASTDRNPAKVKPSWLGKDEMREENSPTAQGYNTLV